MSLQYVETIGLSFNPKASVKNANVFRESLIKSLHEDYNTDFIIFSMVLVAARWPVPLIWLVVPQK